ncbi:hypothetical protein Tco_0534919 [Tanacetum coccineum]
MENVNPPPTHHVLPAALRARFNQEPQELQKILAFIDSRLESNEQFLNRFTKQPNETSINDTELDNGSVDTPLVSPFPHFDNDSDDEEVLNELCEYANTRTLHRERIINSFDGDDLAFECTLSFLFWYFSLGRHLEELHVTWAHLEKKQTSLRTYTNIDQEFLYSGWRRCHRYNVMPSPRRSRQRHMIPRQRQSIRPNPLSRIFSFMTVNLGMDILSGLLAACDGLCKLVLEAQHLSALP